MDRKVYEFATRIAANPDFGKEMLQVEGYVFMFCILLKSGDIAEMEFLESQVAIHSTQGVLNC